jgi:SAM-dependent methyltransferase
MLTMRLENERAFHDHQAAERARAMTSADYLVDDEAYLQHESWIAPAMAALGDVAGKRVLDLGCGHGMASVVLARRGGIVTACDLSLGYIREATRRAAANDVALRFAVCNGERLPFADAAFHCVWGNAILHHFDLNIAAQEIRRVLAPDGVAVFCEPWAGNPLLNWARRRLQYPGKQRTADESPLCHADLDAMRRPFSRVEAHGHQLLSMIGRICRRSALVSFLQRCDQRLLRSFPICQRYCRYVVIVACK